MKEIVANFKKIYANDRWLLVAMFFLFLVSFALEVFVFFALRPTSVMIRTGYADIGGYRDGKWHYMLSFMVLGAIVAIINNILAAKVYGKKGAGVSALFIFASIGVIILAGIYVIKIT
jgi:hypothetical protein